jgi:hypothetical protein
MTIRLSGKSGEAVMLVIMGAMVVGGLVVWLSTGHFHMMPMHGEKHEKTETVSTNHHGSKPEPAIGRSEGREANGVEQGMEGRAGMDAP